MLSFLSTITLHVLWSDGWSIESVWILQMTMLIMSRELFVTIARRYGWFTRSHVLLSAKWKTFVQMSAVCLLIVSSTHWLVYVSGVTMLTIGAMLGMYSAWHYLFDISDNVEIK